MERNDELWLNYLKYRAESSRNLLAGWTFGFVAGPAVCDPSTMKMLGMMAVSTATGVFDFPAMINGTPPFHNGATVVGTPALQTAVAPATQTAGFSPVQQSSATAPAFQTTAPIQNTSTNPGVLSSPAAPANQVPAQQYTSIFYPPQNNLMMSLWNMALQSRNNNPQ